MIEKLRKSITLIKNLLNRYKKNNRIIRKNDREIAVNPSIGHIIGRLSSVVAADF